MSGKIVELYLFGTLSMHLPYNLTQVITKLQIPCYWSKSHSAIIGAPQDSFATSSALYQSCILISKYGAVY